MSKKDLMQGALLVVEAVAAAGALAAVNTAKGNTDRGTYALFVKKDAAGVSTGKGGVDLDVALGALLVLGAAVAPSGIAPHLAALGVGGLATYGARMGAAYGAKHASQIQSAQGIPFFGSYGSNSGYAPRHGLPMGQIDPFVSGFGNAQPVYAPSPYGR